MKKLWEINASTIEESIRIALKQIQKFADKRQLTPVMLTVWEERATEVTVGITFQPGLPQNMAAWITQMRLL